MGAWLQARNGYYWNSASTEVMNLPDNYVRTRFNTRPSKRLRYARILLEDIITFVDKIFPVLPYTSIHREQYATALLVKMRWHAVGVRRKGLWGQACDIWISSLKCCHGT